MMRKLPDRIRRSGLQLLLAGILPALASPAALAQGRTLEDFFTAAMEFSPRLNIAADRVDVGEARRQAATGQLLPQISASASASDNRLHETGVAGLQTYRGERYALQLRQVLFDWRRFSEHGVAYAQENQYEAEYYQELSTVFADVAERYFAVLDARVALETVRAELRAVQRQQEQTSRLRDLQQVPITDQYDVDARLATLQAEEVAAQAEYEINRESLRSITGLETGELFRLGEQTPLEVPEGTAAGWAERARAASHAVNARRYAVEAAGKRVSQSRSAYMPEISIVAQQQTSNIGYDNLPTAERDTTYVGIDVSMPLFAGGSNRASVREALGQESIARNELRQAQLETADEARMMFLQLRATVRRIEAARQTVESMELAVQSRQRSFELGNTTSFNVLDAIRERFAAERDLHSFRFEYINLYLRLLRAAGELDAEDMIEVSGWLEPAENGDGAQP